MSSILPLAAQGLNAAGRQFETAARSVVAASAIGNAAGRPPQAAGKNDLVPANSPPAGATAATSVPAFDLPDLAAGLVDVKQAEISYRAQIDVLAIADRLEDEAIDLIA